MPTSRMDKIRKQAWAIVQTKLRNWTAQPLKHDWKTTFLVKWPLFTVYVKLQSCAALSTMVPNWFTLQED